MGEKETERIGGEDLHSNVEEGMTPVYCFP
jgi:hypothetical protein